MLLLGYNCWLLMLRVKMDQIVRKSRSLAYLYLRQLHRVQPESYWVHFDLPSNYW